MENDSAGVLAEAIRSACIKAALLGYEEAGIRGLCEEGRWDCAVAAIRQLDVRALTASLTESAHHDELPVPGGYT
jgi:hypothetical protein